MFSRLLSHIAVIAVLSIAPFYFYGQTCDFTVTTLPDTTTCDPTIQLQTYIGGAVQPNNPTYTWTPGGTLNNPNIANPIATVTGIQTYTVEVTALDGYNLITNGDFSGGVTGYTPAGYTGSSYINGAGNLFVDPVLCPEPLNPNTNFWGQTVTVTPNTDYIFEFSASGIYNTNNAEIQLNINGTNIGPASILTLNVLNTFTIPWNSGSATSADILLHNWNLTCYGNDFLIDDIGMFEICRKTADVTIGKIEYENFYVDTSLCQGEYFIQDGETLTTSGIYLDTIPSTGCNRIIETTLSFNPNPTKPDLGSDVSLCGNDPFTMNSDVSASSYIWNGVAGNSSNTVTESGTYVLEVIDANQCSNYDTIEVFYQPDPEFELGPDQLICLNDELQLDVTQSDPSTTYSWQDGSTSPTISVVEPGGIYFVTVSIGQCTKSDTVQFTYQDCDCLVAVPTAFSPNQDGINDGFAPLHHCPLMTGYEFLVYNRWGTLVYKSNDNQSSWNGELKNTSQPVGAYVWVMHYIDGRGNPVVKSGEVTLIR